MAQSRIESKRRAPRDAGGLPGWLLGVIGAVIGLVIGLFVAWQVFPATYTSAFPNELGAARRIDWVEMTADAYAFDPNPAEAQSRLGYFSQDELRQLIDAAEVESQGNLAKLERLQALEAQIGTTIMGSGATAPAAEEGGFDGVALAGGIGGLLLTAVLLMGGAVIFTRMQQAQAATPSTRREGGGTPAARRGTSTRNAATLGPPPATGREAVDTPDQPEPALAPDGESEDYPFPASFNDQAASDEDLFDQLFEDTRTEDVVVAPVDDTPRRDFEFSDAPVAPAGYSAALDQFLARYNYGDDGYDMSFSIETPQTEFLGECGVGICDVLGSGSPQKVTAFEVWLFDKDDIRTVTKVLLSDYAGTSEEMRGKLAPKGELVPIKPGDVVDLETKSLRVRARVRELEYGHEGTPRSYFERFVVELTPQQKV